jgi:hypothetical protein
MVLPDLTILLRMLPAFRTKYTRPASLQTTPLEELLAKTKTLRIAGLPPPRQLKVSYNLLLGDGSHWEHVGATTEEARKAVLLAAYMNLWALKEVFTFNMAYLPSVHVPIFTSVERIILGQRSHWNWEDLLRDDSREVYACHQAIDRFISAHSPKSVCTHSAHGPYSLLTAMFTGPRFSKTPPIVTRHAYANYQGVVITPGATNRCYFYPGWSKGTSDRDLYGRPAPPNYDIVGHILFQIADSVNFLGDWFRDGPPARTSLALYLPNSIGMSVEERLDQAINGAEPTGPIYRAANSKLPGVFEQALAGYIDQAKKALEDEIEWNRYLEEHVQEQQDYPRGPKWANLVKCRLWKDVPSCECCGWELEDYVDEMTAGLNPREAILTRTFMGLGAAREESLQSTSVLGDKIIDSVEASGKA